MHGLRWKDSAINASHDNSDYRNFEKLIMVKKEQVKPGACFRFEGGDRRVVAVENGQVHWVYADGIERMGKTDGYQYIRRFAKVAIEEFQQSYVDESRAAFRHAFTKPVFYYTDLYDCGIRDIYACYAGYSVIIEMCVNF